MAESETNVISHLLEIEDEATSIIDAAQIESNERVLSSKAIADELFHSKYAEIVQKFEGEYTETINNYSKSHDEEFESYKNYILQSKKDVESFNAFMNKVLFSS